MRLEILNENQVTATIISIAILLLAAYLCGTLFVLFKAPRVVGEITGGLILGGSCLYYFFPNVMATIFMNYPEQGKLLNIFYQLGLIFLMFSSGFNTRLAVDKKHSSLVGLIFCGATFIPMLLSLPFADFFVKFFIGTSNNQIAFLIVFTIAVAITSIPVIAKIFFDMGIMNTIFANIILTASTLQDLCLWILLNIAIHIVTTGSFTLFGLIFTTAFTIGLFMIIWLITNKIHNINISISTGELLTITFIFLFLSIGILSFFHINIMYSSFLVGYLVKSVLELDEKRISKVNSITDFAFAFFIPIYFALVGIQLNIRHDFSIERFFAFFIMAFCLEGFGTLIVLIFTKVKRKVVVNFAVTMNARGGPGIVLATVAYSYSIINLEFFTVLILTTMLSSLIAGYWLRAQQKKDEMVFVELFDSELDKSK